MNILKKHLVSYSIRFFLILLTAANAIIHYVMGSAVSVLWFIVTILWIVSTGMNYIDDRNAYNFSLEK